ncbi:MAG: hypothetical protein KGH58_00775 [Candidatus Micrarchaeota archaeon]|nr:hypothetical protein [Candidatus Micrarchaeota archaeon]
MSAVSTTREEAIERIEDAIWKFMASAQQRGMLRGVPNIIRLDDNKEIGWKILRDPNPSDQRQGGVSSGNIFIGPNKGLESLIINGKTQGLVALDLSLRNGVLKVTSDGEHDKSFVSMFLDMHKDACATGILRKLVN